MLDNVINPVVGIWHVEWVFEALWLHHCYTTESEKVICSHDSVTESNSSYEDKADAIAQCDV